MQKIAVIVPVHNEELVIQNTIDALLNAGVEKNDLYVVNDASTDNTLSIVKNNNVRLLNLEHNGGKAVAQRKIIRHFLLCERYDYIVFLDGDSIVDKNFLSEFRKAAKIYPNAGLLVGQVKSTRGNYLSALRSVEYAVGHDIYKSGQSNFGLIFVAPGCVSMYKSSVLKQLKIEFDTLAEDMDLTMQVQRLGKEIKYVPNAIVYTQDPKTISDYIKQVTRWQRGGWQVFKKHKVGNVTKRQQKVDWWIIFLTLDAFIFNRLIWLLIGLLVLPVKLAFMAVVMDIMIYFVLSCYTAVKNKRWDVIWKFPKYFWINYINLITYFKTFFEVIVLKQDKLTWNKVQRY